jgi:hypothetical protein
MSSPVPVKDSPFRKLEGQSLVYLRELDKDDYVVENEGPLNGHLISKSLVKTMVEGRLSSGKMLGEWDNPTLKGLSAKESIRRFKTIDPTNLAAKLGGGRVAVNANGQHVIEADAFFPDGAPDVPVRYVMRAFVTVEADYKRITHILTWDVQPILEGK